MKKVSSVFFVFFVLFIGEAFAQIGFGSSRLINDGWEFRLEGEPQWRSVTLPHDWSIEHTPSDSLFSCTGFLPGGVGYYRLNLNNALQHSSPSLVERVGERLVYLYFEGVYNRSEVSLNGHLLGKRPNGYASFAYEITPYINPSGDNILEVRVDHSRQADSRWYTGSGIYRDVWLVTAPKQHLPQWGVTWRWDGENSNLIVKTGGITPCRFTLRDSGGNTIVSSKDSVLHISNPHLWNLSDPYLYTLTTEYGEDQTTCHVGLRTTRFSPDEGFFLNGVNTKVRGVCIHHDAGVLGAAVPYEVWLWRLTQLKKIGVNGIRCAHNPQVPYLYDLCDELGLLVMDEASDEWEFPKRKWLKGWNKGTPGYEGSYDFFNEWIDRDVEDMVLRDRNHPSIFLWSIGNEVDYPNDPYSHPVLDGGNSKINQPMYGGFKADAPRAERIGEIAKRLAAIVRRCDDSRAVTGALAGVVMSNETAYPDAVDVVGYNYTENRYELDHKTYPDRVIYGSETNGGIRRWKEDDERPYIFGQFLWTGLDYLGESGAWPSRGLGTGILDFCGFQKSWGPRRRGNFANSHNPAASTDPAACSLRVALLNDSLPELSRYFHDQHPSRPVKLVLLEMADENGTRVMTASDTVRCSVSGGATLLGLENGDNRDMSAPQASERRLCQGRLLAYIRVDGPSAKVTFSVGEKSLTSYL